MTDTGPVSTTAEVVVDTGSRDLGAVEHLVRCLDEALGDLLPDDHLVSTHVVREPVAHLATVVAWSGPDSAPVAQRALERITGLVDAGTDAGARLLVASPELRSGARQALAAHRTRSSGRLARYPGRTAVEQRVSAAEVVARSCVDAVEGLAGTVVGPQTALDLTGFARPTWHDGRCTLLVQQGAGGVLVPFEPAQQTPCCANH